MSHLFYRQYRVFHNNFFIIEGEYLKKTSLLIQITENWHENVELEAAGIIIRDYMYQTF